MQMLKKTRAPNLIWPEPEKFDYIPIVDVLIPLAPLVTETGRTFRISDDEFSRIQGLFNVQVSFAY
jgi:hypothetical protein